MSSARAEARVARRLRCLWLAAGLSATAAPLLAQAPANTDARVQAPTRPLQPVAAQTGAADAQPAPSDKEPSSPSPQALPPKLLNDTPQRLPRELLAELPARDAQEPPVVKLRLRVAADGSIESTELLQDVGPRLAARALQLARTLRFSAATRRGQPVASIISVALSFEPEPATTPTPAPQTAHALDPTTKPIEVTIRPPSRAQQARASADAVSLLELDTAQREGTDTATVIARQQGMTARRSGGLGSSARVSMNGYTDGQVRVFLDGLPLEAAGFPFGLASVPLALIDHIEVYRGVVPIRFGSDALGGAIALWSYTPAPTQQQQHVSYRVGSFDTHRISARTSAVDAVRGWFGRADVFFDRARNDYRMQVAVPNREGRSEPRLLHRRNADYAAQGALLTVGLQGKAWARRLTLRGHFGTYEKGVPHNLLATVPYGAVRQSARSFGLQLDHEAAWSRFELTTRVLASWRRTRLDDRSPCTHDWFGACVAVTEPGEIGLRALDQRVLQPALLARVQGSVQLAPEHTLELSLAPSLFTRSGRDAALAQLGQLDALEGERALLSWVAAASYQVALAGDRVRAQAFGKYYGMRARAQELQADGSFGDRNQDVHRAGMGFGVRADLSHGLAAKLTYEWATRLPSPDELFGDAVLTVSNLALEPERSHNLNATLAFQGEHARWGKADLEVTAFARAADALIIQIVGVESARYENIGSSRALGVQSQMRWSPASEWLTFDGSFTYQDLRNTSQTGAFAATRGDRLPNRPYLFGSLAATTLLRGAFSPLGVLSLTLRGHFVHRYFYGWSGAAQRADKPAVPGQAVASVVLTYSTHLEGRELSASVEVHNLTDAAVFDNLNVQLPGRAAYATVTATL